MAYVVNVTSRAERDLALIYDALNAARSDAALRWYQRFEQAILSLEETPNRCPVTSENHRLRHLSYGGKPNVYRIIYRVLEKQRQVDVLHIRHTARRPFDVSQFK